MGPWPEELAPPPPRRPDPVFLSDEDLDLALDELDAIIKAKRPAVSAPAIARWTAAAARTLDLLAPRFLAAVSFPTSKADVLAERIGLRKAAGDVPADVWAEIERALTRMLTDLYDDVGEEGWTTGNRLLGVQADYSHRQIVAPSIQSELARRVTMIDDATRDEVRRMTTTAIERGYSVDELRNGKGDDFAGLRSLFGSTRAETIARTETANAYNLGTLDRYSASGLVEMVNTFDGGNCGWTTHTDPDLANGKRVPIAEARAVPISHPNCQRSFGAVIAGAPPAGAPGAQTVRPPSAFPKPGTDALGRQARAIQARRFAQASKAEPGVTKSIDRLASRTGGKAMGTDFRLKADGTRTVEKITADVRAGEAIELAGKVKDALRYTIAYDERALYAGVRDSITALRREGNALIKYRDNFDSPLNRDINTAFRTPDGERFELQFHTRDSYVRKEVAGGVDGNLPPAHAVYEELRRLGDDQGEEAHHLGDLLRQIWEGIGVPPGRWRPPAGWLDPDLLD